LLARRFVENLRLDMRLTSLTPGTDYAVRAAWFPT
jgi:hypothetical protein